MKKDYKGISFTRWFAIQSAIIKWSCVLAITAIPVVTLVMLFFPVAFLKATTIITCIFFLCVYLFASIAYSRLNNEFEDYYIDLNRLFWTIIIINLLLPWGFFFGVHRGLPVILFSAVSFAPFCLIFMVIRSVGWPREIQDIVDKISSAASATVKFYKKNFTAQ